MGEKYLTTIKASCRYCRALNMVHTVVYCQEEILRLQTRLQSQVSMFLLEKPLNNTCGQYFKSKFFLKDWFRLGKPVPILTTYFLASTTKKLSHYLKLYYKPFLLPNLAMGIMFTLVVLQGVCKVMPRSILLHCTSKLHKSSYWAYKSNINIAYLYFFNSGWPRSSKECWLIR